MAAIDVEVPKVSFVVFFMNKTVENSVFFKFFKAFESVPHFQCSNKFAYIPSVYNLTRSYGRCFK